MTLALALALLLVLAVAAAVAEVLLLPRAEAAGRRAGERIGRWLRDG